MLIKIQSCLYQGHNSESTIETVSSLKVLLSVDSCDVRSARPDLHLFYSDGRSGINLLTNRDVVWKNQATCPRPKAEDR